MTPFFGGCSAVAGSFKLRAERQPGVLVTEVEGLGCTSLAFRDYQTLYLGWSKHVLVFEGEDNPDILPMSEVMGVFAPLPASEAVYVSSSSAGLQIAWEPAFRGFAVGFQTRTTARLPVNRSMVFECHPSSETVIDDIPRFKLNTSL